MNREPFKMQVLEDSARPQKLRWRERDLKLNTLVLFSRFVHLIKVYFLVSGKKNLMLNGPAIVLCSVSVFGMTYRETDFLLQNFVSNNLGGTMGLVRGRALNKSGVCMCVCVCVCARKPVWVHVCVFVYESERERPGKRVGGCLRKQVGDNSTVTESAAATVERKHTHRSKHAHTHIHTRAQTHTHTHTHTLINTSTLQNGTLGMQFVKCNLKATERIHLAYI